MKKWILFSLVLGFSSFSPTLQARHTMGISLFGGGNFPITHTFPDLDTGAGGGLSFDYRFNQRWALATQFSVYLHDGGGVSKADDALVLNVPDVSLKFYLFGDEKNFDPYLSAGMGVGVVTEGKSSDNSGGAGMAATVSLGFDYYFADSISMGIAAQFKTLGIIRDSSQSSALIFLTSLGHITFHFK